MDVPPEELDGAIVLYYAKLTDRHRKTGVVRHFIETAELDKASGLAICRYAGTKEGYLFHCNEDWEVLTDDYYNSVEEAFKWALMQFGGLNATDWVKVEDIDELEQKLLARKAAWFDQLPDDYVAEETLRRLANEGQALEAMKRLREVKNWSLFDAHQ